MKRTALILLLALLLLAGCAQEESAEPPAESAAPAEAVPTPAAAEETPPDPIVISAELYTPEGGRYTLRDSDGLLLEVLFTKDPYAGAMILLRAENRSGEDLRLLISDLLLNGNVQTGDELTLDVPAGGETLRTYLSKTQMSCAIIGYENVRELSLALEISREGGETVRERCGVSIPEGIRLSYAYTSFRAMRADRQVLREDGQLTAALLACGLFCSDLDYPMLSGVLWIENRGSEPIPASLSGLSVNGTFLPVYAADRTVEPGSSCLIDFTVSAGDFDRAGIEEIESLSLQLLTSREENSGGVRAAEGGSWYPVALARAGHAETGETEGELLYDDGLLELRFVRAAVSPRASAYSAAEYTLLVVNRRTEGISLWPADAMLGGEPYRDAVNASSYIGRDNDRIGPQSRGYMVLTLYLPAEAADEPAPPLSFLLQVRSQGGDSIFYSIADRIQIGENKEEQP